MKETAEYGRVSTEHKEQLDALENQIQYYDEVLARFKDRKLYKRYIDKGITGTSVEKRDSFKEMIRDAEAGCFDLIITREISRFGRNTEDTLREVRKLRRIGVEVYFVEDNIWSIQDPEADLKITLYSAFAENESRKTSVRVKAGQKISFENGVFYGTGNILGYDYNNITKEVTINHEQAKTVRLIYDMYLKGNGTRNIQYELERRGYLTSSGLTRWSPSNITRVLKNPFYCGTVVYRKSYIPDFLEQKPKKNKGQVEQVIVEGKHEPLVTKEEFAKVQEMLSSHRTNNNGNETKVGKIPTTIYGKKIRCKCGCSMQKKLYHKYKDGHKSWCYQCYGQINSGSYTSRKKHGVDLEGICDTKIIPEWKLKIIFYMVFEKIWLEREEILDIIDSLLDGAITDSVADDIIEETEHITRQLECCKKKKSKLLDGFISERINDEDYSNKNAELELEISMLEMRLSDLSAQEVDSTKAIEQKLEQCKNKIRTEFNYKRGDLSDELVDSFVDKIVIHNNLVEVHLNFAKEIGNFLNKSCNEEADGMSILLGRFSITKDDATTYSKYNDELSRVYLKEPLVVEIYV